MTSSTEVKIYKNPRKVSKAIAREIKNLSRQPETERLNIAVSGGKTPELLFAVLVEKHKDAIPWDKIHFWWVDERCVPPEDEESNYNLARELLFSYIDIPGENIHRIKGESDPDEEALLYAAEIRKNLPIAGGIPVFDLVLLGMGDDGHTASIFPGYLELIDDKRVCAVTQHPSSGLKRVTLTGSVIKNAHRIFFMVTGENKAARISEIMNNNEAAKLLPAYYIEPVHGTLIWFIDEAAASQMD
jgi:6-phosphogluconolactonase